MLFLREVSNANNVSVCGDSRVGSSLDVVLNMGLKRRYGLLCHT